MPPRGKFNSHLKLVLSLECTKSFIKPPKRKKPHEDIGKKFGFNPPNQFHIFDTMEANPSQDRRSVDDITSTRKVNEIFGR